MTVDGMGGQRITRQTLEKSRILGRALHGIFHHHHQNSSLRGHASSCRERVSRKDFVAIRHLERSASHEACENAELQYIL